MSTAEYEKFESILIINDCECSKYGVGIKSGCKGILKIDDIKKYPHEGGINVPISNEKQWVYVVCPECGYQHAWYKVISAYEHIKKS